MTAYDPSQWSDFALAQLGASAALLGLVFVGMSINLKEFVGTPLLVNRALEAIVLLATVLVTATAVLIPDQSREVVGVELLAIGLFTTLSVLRLQAGVHADVVARGDRGPTRGVRHLPADPGARERGGDRGRGRPPARRGRRRPVLVAGRDRHRLPRRHRQRLGPPRRDPPRSPSLRASRSWLSHAHANFEMFVRGVGSGAEAPGDVVAAGAELGAALLGGDDGFVVGERGAHVGQLHDPGDR